MKFSMPPHEAMSVVLIALLLTTILLIVMVTVSLDFRHFNHSIPIGFGLILVCVFLIIAGDQILNSGRVPIWGIVLFIWIAVAYGLMSIMSAERRRRKVLSRYSIKESLDNLPSGVCFFHEDGTLTLCNRQMYNLVYELTGHDVQQYADFKEVIRWSSGSSLVDGGKSVFRIAGKIWHFKETPIVDSKGNKYIQVVATDVTELYDKRQELTRENESLKRAVGNLQKLSDSILTETREEEILSLKMRVHDEMGRSLINIRRVLSGEEPLENANNYLRQMSYSLQLLGKRTDKPTGKNIMQELKDACKGMGIDIMTSGKLPASESAAYLIVTAARECVTNAVRYAGATSLYVKIFNEEEYVMAFISNNGEPPTGPIVEGGGLSSLRHRIEKKGGTMDITSYPGFELRIRIPI